MTQAAATFIRAVHFLVVIFVVFAPFSGDEALLSLHAVFIPSLMLHWLMNSQVCCLTLLEAQLRGVPMTHDEVFLHRLISPVYSMNESEHRNFVYGASTLLWIKTMMELRKRDFQLFRAMYRQIYRSMRGSSIPKVEKPPLPV